jgi:hypothetical protein
MSEQEKNQELKGKYKGNCNREVCQKPGAIWYNHSTRMYYCIDCARDINEATYPESMRLYGHELCTLQEEKGSILMSEPAFGHSYPIKDTEGLVIVDDIAKSVDEMMIKSSSVRKDNVYLGSDWQKRVKSLYKR